MISPRLASLAVLIGMAPAWNAFTLEAPTGSALDGRIKRVDYDERDVVAVDVSLSNATQISFGSGEEILDIASGFSQGWEFVARRNHLYLKARSIKAGDGPQVAPSPGEWDTNLIVTTSAHVYTFQLVAHADRVDRRLGYDPSVAFRVEFRYPADEARRRLQEEAAEASRRALERKTAPRSWNYSMQVGPGAESIVPSMAYDDGRFTYLRFPAHREFPSAFVVIGGRESLVNTYVDPVSPDVLVIQQVAPQFVLRLGTEVVAVFNEGFDPDGRTIRQEGLRLDEERVGLYSEFSQARSTAWPASGTAVPGVRRVVRGGGAEVPGGGNAATGTTDRSTLDSIGPVDQDLRLREATKASRGGGDE